MRRNNNADCTGEPPGELIASATPESPDSAKARSSALAWLPKDSAVRHCRGPMTPSRRMTATVAAGLRKRSIGRNFRSSRGFITPQHGDCSARGVVRLQDQGVTRAEDGIGRRAGDPLIL